MTLHAVKRAIPKDCPCDTHKYWLRREKAFLPGIKRHRTGHGIGTTDKAAIDKAFDDLLRQVSKERLKTSEVTITVSLVEGSEPERCQP